MKSESMVYEIRTAMHPFPHTIGKKQSLKTARDVMREHNVRHLPVLDSGKLIGVISERDINFALRVDHKEPEELAVGDAYTADPFVVDQATPVSEVAARMAIDRIGCTLVTEKGTLVGVFTTVDACRVLAEVLSGRLEQ